VKNLDSIAPYITKSLDDITLISIENIRIFIEDIMNQNIQMSGLYINHAISHSEVILRVSSEILESRNIILNEYESYVLVAVCYCHDIGLFTPNKENIDVDQKKYHGEISAQFIMKNMNIFLDVVLAGIIDDICVIHDNPSVIYNTMNNTTIYNTYEIRVKLIALIFALADSLDLGLGRTIGPSYLQNFRNKVFWYRNSCVSEIKIKERLIIYFDDLYDLNETSLTYNIIYPILEYIDKILKFINMAFSDNNIIGIILEYKVNKNVTNKNLIMPDNIFKLSEEIINETKSKKNIINKKIVKDGLIKSGLVNNELFILKQWSSFTPRMPEWYTNSSNSKGGGYFLVWNNMGLIIDPGYDFLKNLWLQSINSDLSFEIEDINAIVVSHAHDDHSNDIEPIVSLLYKYQGIKKHSQVPIYCSEGVHIKYERLFSNNMNLISITDLVSATDKSKFIDNSDKFIIPNGISIEYIRNKHNERPWMLNNTGVSMKFHLSSHNDKFIVGYTSDTPYFEELVDFFKDADILIMHLGNIGPIPTTKEEIEYDQNHLGLSGCCDLISKLLLFNPKLFLVGEFGEEEVGKNRIEICNILEDFTRVKEFSKRIIPMDIGLRIKLPEISVFNEEQSIYSDYKDIIPKQIKNNTKEDCHRILYSNK